MQFLFLVFLQFLYFYISAFLHYNVNIWITMYVLWNSPQMCPGPPPASPPVTAASPAQLPRKKSKNTLSSLEKGMTLSGGD